MTWTRRRFLTATGAAAVAARRTPAWALAAKTITVSHSVSTFVYGQHLVAKEKKFFEDEGLAAPSFIVPGGGAKVAQALAAGGEGLCVRGLCPPPWRTRPGYGRPQASF